MGPIRHINCVLADIKTCFLSKENGTCFIKIWQLRVKGTEIKLQSTNLNKTTKKLVTQLGKRNENEGIKGRLNMYSSISKSCRRRVLAASEQSVTAANPSSRIGVPRTDEQRHRQRVGSLQSTAQACPSQVKWRIALILPASMFKPKKLSTLQKFRNTSLSFLVSVWNSLL